MILLVPAHPGSPGQGHKTVVVVVVVVHMSVNNVTSTVNNIKYI